MKHYDYSEWLFYKIGSLPEYKRIEMEDHLFQCESCMNIFISLIDKVEIEKAAEIIPKDFNKNVLKQVKNVRPITKKVKTTKRNYNDMFLYYTAVASVAIILTAGGFFTTLVDTMPEITASINSQQEIRGNKIYDFSETITSKTSEFINNFQVNKGRIEDETKK